MSLYTYQRYSDCNCISMYKQLLLTCNHQYDWLYYTRNIPFLLKREKTNIIYTIIQLKHCLPLYNYY